MKIQRCYTTNHRKEASEEIIAEIIGPAKAKLVKEGLK